MDKSSINAQKSLVQLQAQANELYQIISSESSRPALSLLGILNKLNSFDGPWKEVPDQQVIEFLFLGSKSLPTTHEACSAFCKFMFKQCSKQIRLSSLRSFQFDSCITFLLNGLETTEAPELRVDLLRALSALVFENTSNVSRFYPRLATNLLVLANRSIKPLEVRRMAINCIGNTCAGAGPKLNAYYKDYYEVLLSNLCVVDHTSRGTIMVASSSLDFTDPGVRKIASSTLRALQFLLSQDKTLVTNPLCDMIDIVYNFVFAHVSVQAYNPIPPKIDNPMPIQLSASTSKQRLGQIRTQQQQQQQQPISPSTRTQFSWRPSMLSRTMGALSSDSELSDSDSPLNSLRKQRDDAKIRINALLCLAAIAKTSPRALYPNWHKFIPDSMTIFFNNNTEIGSNSQRLSPTLRSDNQPFSLFTLIIYDPTVTVRTAACNALIAMLEGSKQYLSIASERDTKSSFTSLSERVASILRDLHAGIMIALNKEQTPQVQALLLKVTPILIATISIVIVIVFYY
ncbi:hypothetical protein J3Q64DRAFT_1200073 [Phycomyces blakesleeanus]|uniref:DUF4042 domain-containing protein n=1 Tax=Phycomyces blakesleeanus TaxID=4837 RepID=A0ABR3ASE9_PHYBL